MSRSMPAIPVLRHGNVPADVVAVQVHPGPGLGHDERLGSPRDHLTQQGRAAAGGHVHESHLGGRKEGHWKIPYEIIFRVRLFNVGLHFFAAKVAFSYPSVDRFGKQFWGLMTLGQVESIPNFC